MYVSQMAFHARVSDPMYGGTYMTLLNTVTNMAGNWPTTVALWLVDDITKTICQGSTNTTVGTCGTSTLQKVKYIHYFAYIKRTIRAVDPITVER